MECNVLTRDSQLDLYRALIMIYIVCWIHGIYWFDTANDVVKSISLFEMPIIFFIAGASQKLSKPKGVVQTIRNRFKRVLLPWYIFLVPLLLWVLTLSYFNPDLGKFHIDFWSLHPTEILKLLVTAGDHSPQIPFLNYNWFIVPYFLIACSFPIQKKILKYVRPLIYMILLLGVCLAISNEVFPAHIQVKNFCYYNTFFMMGFFLYRNIKKQYILECLPISLGIMVYMIGGGYKTSVHKFPLDFSFLVYCTSAIVVLSALFSYIKIGYNSLLYDWNKNGYSIYLYQCFTAFFFYSVSYSWLYSIDSLILRSIITFLSLLIINSLFSLLVVRYNNIAMHIINSCVNANINRRKR